MTAPPWKPEPIETFFMFGTGICEGSWDPVRQAILDVDPSAPVEVNSKPEAGQLHWDEIRAANDASNFWFADLVHKRRRIQAIIAAPSEELERRTELRTSSEIEAFREKARAVGKELARVDEDVKDAIVRRLKKAVAAESLRIRPQFWRVMGDERFAGSAWFSTTNWDTALERTVEVQFHEVLNKVDHIHGSTGWRERILLPSEVVEEPYRTEEQREAVTHSVLPYVPLNWASQVCLYGLSLSVSDAELAATLEMGFDRHKLGPGTIVIVNRRDQFGVLTRRVRRLSGEAWKVECIDVDSLK